MLGSASCTSKLTELISQAEKLLFHKEIDSQSTLNRSSTEVSAAAHLIFAAYYGVQENPELLQQVFYLARVIRVRDRNSPYGRREPFISDRILSEGVRDIANIGRDIAKSIPPTQRERIEQGQLYETPEYVVGGQVRDPRRGANASICSNCIEPIRFSDILCPECDYVLISPQGMPDKKTWETLSVHHRIDRLAVAHAIMFSQIAEQYANLQGLQNSRTAQTVETKEKYSI